MNEAVRRTEAVLARPQGPMTMVLEGEIGRDDLPDIGSMLMRLAEKGHVDVVIDFTHVTHFDFRGVKPLVRKAEAFRHLGGDLALAGLSPYLHAIFRSAGANDAFDYFASVDEARTVRALTAHLPPGR